MLVQIYHGTIPSKSGRIRVGHPGESLTHPPTEPLPPREVLLGFYADTGTRMYDRTGATSDEVEPQTRVDAMNDLDDAEDEC